MKGETLHTGHTGPVYALAAGKDGTLLSGGSDGLVLAWDRAQPGEVRAVAKAPATVLSLLSLGDPFCVGTSTGELIVVDPAAKRSWQTMAHSKGLYAIAAMGPERIACAGGDGILSIWIADGNNGYECARNIALCDGKLRGLALSRSGDQLAVACGDGHVRVLDTVRFNELTTLAGHAGGANVVRFHPDKHVLFSGGKDGHLRVWDVQGEGREILALPAHRSTIYAIAFDPQGRWCASASRDKTVKLWDAASLDPAARGVEHTHSVNALCWSGNSLFSVGDDRKMVRWRTV